jgi:hypothetical protein
MHHVVIIIMIVMLTLCYSVMSHATLILYYHASMLALHTFIISHVLWLHIQNIEEVRVYSRGVYSRLGPHWQSIGYSNFD